MELQLHEGSALDRLGFDVLDAGDVEEVILVVIGEVTFHLRRVHAAVGLGDVDGGNAEGREDVAGHALERDPRPEDDGDDQHDNRERPAQGRLHEVHRRALGWQLVR